MRETMTVAEAARYLGISKQHLHNSIKKGALSVVVAPSMPHQRGPSLIRYVLRAELDAIRADGFFRSRRRTGK